MEGIILKSFFSVSLKNGKIRNTGPISPDGKKKKKKMAWLEYYQAFLDKAWVTAHYGHLLPSLCDLPVPDKHVSVIKQSNF